VKPPGGILPLGLCGVADVAGSSADTMTPGMPINSPVKGFTEIKVNKINKHYFSLCQGLYVIIM
jgi:hypothetical protein